MGVRSVDINNYPLLDELVTDAVAWSTKKTQVCYVGGIGRIRGIHEMVKAMAFTDSDIRFALGGRFSEPQFECEVRAEDGWKKTDHVGWLDRQGVKATLNESIAGLVTLHPVTNYLDSLPVKMFEYMATGLPVVASDFPFWRPIIEESQCGICVDPLDPKAIAQAIDYLAKNPTEAERMGRNGQRAVRERYNWCVEEQKLLALYESLV